MGWGVLGFYTCIYIYVYLFLVFLGWWLRISEACGGFGALGSRGRLVSMPSPSCDACPYISYGQYSWLTKRTWIPCKGFSRGHSISPI